GGRAEVSWLRRPSRGRGQRIPTSRCARASGPYGSEVKRAFLRDPLRMPSTLRIFVNVNGVLTSAEEAHVSPLDHGFLYGDSVYETVRTYHERPFLLGRHLDRLQRS